MGVVGDDPLGVQHLPDLLQPGGGQLGIEQDIEAVGIGDTQKGGEGDSGLVHQHRNRTAGLAAPGNGRTDDTAAAKQLGVGQRLRFVDHRGFAWKTRTRKFKIFYYVFFHNCDTCRLHFICLHIIDRCGFVFCCRHILTPEKCFVKLRNREEYGGKMAALTKGCAKVKTFAKMSRKQIR